MAHHKVSFVVTRGQGLDGEPGPCILADSDGCKLFTGPGFSAAFEALLLEMPGAILDLPEGDALRLTLEGGLSESETVSTYLSGEQDPEPPGKAP